MTPEARAKLHATNKALTTVVFRRSDRKSSATLRIPWTVSIDHKNKNVRVRTECGSQRELEISAKKYLQTGFEPLSQENPS
jgi:hypothetical protein